LFDQNLPFDSRLCAIPFVIIALILLWLLLKKKKKEDKPAKK
jgi:hypothetical protein